MNSPIKLGTPVRQVMPSPVEGVVVDKKFVAQTDSFQYLVEWPDSPDDADADPQSKWFDEGQIVAIEEPTGEDQ